jgi:hypothetical protein
MAFPSIPVPPLPNVSVAIGLFRAIEQFAYRFSLFAYLIGWPIIVLAGEGRR